MFSWLATHVPWVRTWVLNRFSRVQLCVIPWIVAHQAPLSMGFSRQEYWSGLPWSPPGHLPYPGIELASLSSNVYWQAGSLPLAPPGKPSITFVQLSSPWSCLVITEPEFKNHLSQRWDIDTNHRAQQSAWVANEKEISRKVKTIQLMWVNTLILWFAKQSKRLCKHLPWCLPYLLKGNLLAKMFKIMSTVLNKYMFCIQQTPAICRALWHVL